MSQNQQLQQNFLYGLANKKLLCLLQVNKYNQKLKDMEEVSRYTSSQSTSSALKATLSKSTKQAIRGCLQLSAQALLEDRTILDIKDKRLKSLAPKCDFIMIETNDQQHLEIKLVFKDTKK